MLRQASSELQQYSQTSLAPFSISNTEYLLPDSWRSATTVGSSPSHNRRHLFSTSYYSKLALLSSTLEVLSLKSILSTRRLNRDELIFDSKRAPCTLRDPHDVERQHIDTSFVKTKAGETSSSMPQARHTHFVAPPSQRTHTHTHRCEKPTT